MVLTRGEIIIGCLSAYTSSDRYCVEHAVYKDQYIVQVCFAALDYCNERSIQGAPGRFAYCKVHAHLSTLIHSHTVLRDAIVLEKRYKARHSVA
jgi:hypothetical protein